MTSECVFGPKKYQFSTVFTSHHWKIMLCCNILFCTFNWGGGGHGEEEVTKRYEDYKCQIYCIHLQLTDYIKH